MHCFACNKELQNDVIDDKPTGRYYCTECFAFTVDEQLRILEAEDKPKGDNMFKNWEDDQTQGSSDIPFIEDIYEDEWYDDEIAFERRDRYEQMDQDY